MNLIINDGVFFRKIVSSIKELMVNTEFLFNEDGMCVQSMDTNRICMIDIFLPNNSFEKYVLDNPCKVGIKIDNLNNILKLSKNSNIKIKRIKDQDTVNIDVSETTRKKIKFEMKIINDIENEHLQMAEFHYEYKINLETAEFKKTIMDLSTFGDKCNITGVINTNSITFTVSGDGGTGSITIDDMIIETSDDAPSNINQTYPFKYLLLFAKANLADNIKLKLSTTGPLCCEYQLEYGRSQFFLGQIHEQ